MVKFNTKEWIMMLAVLFTINIGFYLMWMGNGILSGFIGLITGAGLTGYVVGLAMEGMKKWRGF